MSAKKPHDTGSMIATTITTTTTMRRHKGSRTTLTLSNKRLALPNCKVKFGGKGNKIRTKKVASKQRSRHTHTHTHTHTNYHKTH